MKIILPEEGIHVEALQTKYPLIDWEIHSEDTMKFWKIIRVGNYIEVYQTFADMLKNFDRYDLVKLCGSKQAKAVKCLKESSAEEVERFDSEKLEDLKG
ncbi:hypothetical protein Tco_0893070 [Tanacetum coccineum]|uniref:Uncharacterized protein n=1 Tax=Tanacetum coccineum TaxID=301880 RepID=A0ABQ5CAN9_9ASTR